MFFALTLTAAVSALTPAEVDALCTIVPDTKLGSFALGIEWETNPLRERTLSERIRGLRFKETPRRLRCGTRKLLLNPRGYGNFLNSVAMSFDGQEIAIAIGFQYAPLLGGGGSCLYRRTLGSWKLEGCVHEWDS